MKSLTSLSFLGRSLVRASVLGGGVLLSASGAFAQDSECEVDADCEQGFECQVTGGSSCAGPACAPDEDCEPVVCETEEFRSCVPGSCETDSDCAENMVCESHELGACSQPACSSDGDCPEAECTSEVYSRCEYRWNLSCEAAADCGEGFDCVELEECSCSGGEAGVPTDNAGTPGAGATASSGSTSAGSGTQASGGAPSSGGEGAAGPVPPADPAVDPLAPALPPDCECAPSGVGYCALQEIECGSDAECPADWSCVKPPRRINRSWRWRRTPFADASNTPRCS